ncbi:uncharacterized protein VTP21DRAFT_460 [Calcarisporiella thermophila]|uniref:uncharacterized protein n=1 Tax=Calcarisporiella thermophila TaxID=911321 RepID=UPI0037423F61
MDAKKQDYAAIHGHEPMAVNGENSASSSKSTSQNPFKPQTSQVDTSPRAAVSTGAKGAAPQRIPTRNWNIVRDYVLRGETSSPEVGESNRNVKPTGSIGDGRRPGGSQAEGTFTAMRGVLRFKTTVQQRSDMHRMEKELQRVLTSHGSVGAGQTGFTKRLSFGKQSESNVEEAVPVHPILGELFEVLRRWTNAVQMPMMQEVLSELSKPFLSYPVNVDDCMLALDIFDFIRENFVPASDNENMTQILWCCRLLETKHVKTKIRVLTTVKLLLAPTSKHRTPPQTIAVVHSLTYTFVHTLASLNASLSEKSHNEELAHIQSNLHSFLAQLADGSLIHVPPESYTQVESGATTEEITQCIFLEGLVKCLLVRDLRVRKYLVQHLLKTYWVEPKRTIQAAWEHIVFMFADAATEILSDSTFSTIDPDKILESLPYHLLFHMHSSLAPNRIQGISRHIISALCAVCVSSLAIKSGTIDERRKSISIGQRWSGLDTTTTSFGFLGAGSETDGIKTPDPLMQLAKDYLKQMWDYGYHEEIIDLVSETIEGDNFERFMLIYHPIVFGISDEIGSAIVKETLPKLFDRLCAVNPKPTRSIYSLLKLLMSKHRPHFYKPILACVASDDMEKVVQTVNLIVCLERYIPTIMLFIQDPELMSVIALSDVGTGNKRNDSGESESENQPKFASTTLGQCMILFEFIWAIRHLRCRQIESDSLSETIELTKKFLVEFERHVSIILAAKEKTKRLVPMPLRVLLCNLFFEIRMFCKTMHRPGWLSRALDWATRLSPKIIIDRSSTKPDMTSAKSGLYSEDSPFQTASSHQIEKWLDEVTIMFQKVRMVSAIVDENEVKVSEKDDIVDRPVSIMSTKSFNSHTHDGRTLLRPSTPSTSRNGSFRRRSAFTFPGASGADTSSTALSPISTDHAARRLYRVNQVNQDPYGSVLSLLVSVYAMLTPEDLSRLAPYLWEKHLQGWCPKSFHPATFLIMQCGEKIPHQIVAMISQDLYDSNPVTRADCVRKLSAIFGYRFDLLTQVYLPDPSRRRPFRGHVLNVPFVSTDLGSTKLSLDEPIWMSKLRHASNFPIEMRKKIEELGWEEEDVEERERLKRLHTPVSLMPTASLDDEEEPSGGNGMDQSSSGAGLDQSSRSVTSTRQTKKRGVLVPAFSFTSLSLVDLLNEPHGGVHNQVHELILYFLRDDPLIFLRSFFSELGKAGPDRQRELLTRLSYLLSMQNRFPPGFVFHLFNHLTGLLKWHSRENKEGGLELMTLVHPLLAALIASTNDLSIRDLRKNKVEVFLGCTGQFWFNEGTPASMFPRGLTSSAKGFEVLDLPLQLFLVTMLRISHVHLMTNYLIRYPREVFSVKKTFHPYVPMSLTGAEGEQGGMEDEEFFFPSLDFLVRSGSHRTPSKREHDAKMISALRARNWIRFVHTMLQRLNRNYNDRKELQIIINGVNYILQEHHHDYGIVGQAVVVYIHAADHFRRLFNNNRGYSIFLPSLFRVFCEAEHITAIRTAIIFAWSRFFSLHAESFVFQALGCLVPLILKAYDKSDDLGKWMTQSLHTLLKSLGSSSHMFSSADLLGVALEMEMDEKQARVNDTEDGIPNFPNPNNTLSRKYSQLSNGNSSLPVTLPVDRVFSLEDSFKLFLTVIAYDPGSLRAEQMVRMLGHMVQFLMEESQGMVQLVSEGISALLGAFVRFAKSSRPFLGASGGLGAGTEEEASNEADALGGNRRAEQAQNAYGKQWLQNDRLNIKKEFVQLIRLFLKAGGALSDADHERVANLIRFIIRDYVNAKINCNTKWIQAYIADGLRHIGDTEQMKSALLHLLTALHPPYKQNMRTIDFSDMVGGIAAILRHSNGMLAGLPDIASVVREKFVSAGLANVVRYTDWEGEASTRQILLCENLSILMATLMTFSNEDVLREIEKLVPSPFLLAHVVIGVCVHFRPDESVVASISSNALTTGVSQRVTSQWMRLLTYTVRACTRESILKAKPVGFSLSSLGSASPTAANESDDQRPLSTNLSSNAAASATATATLMIVFNALKLILVLAEKHLRSVPDIWVRVALFTQRLLGQPSGMGLKISFSGQHTPLQEGGFGMEFFGGTSPAISPLANPGLSPGAASNPFTLRITPTAVDFVLWSFLELVTLYKTPLFIYMRTFIHEKLHEVPAGITSSMLSPMGSPSSAASPVLLGSSAAQRARSQENSRRSRWRSWGGSTVLDRSPSISDRSGLDVQQDSGNGKPYGTSPTVVGLGIQSSPSIPQEESSGSFLHPHSNTSDVESRHSSHIGGRSFSSSRSPYASMRLSRSPLSSRSMPGTNILEEILRAMSSVRASMGYDTPSLSNSRVQYWSRSLAVQQLMYERSLILQTYFSEFYMPGFRDVAGNT